MTVATYDQIVATDAATVTLKAKIEVALAKNAGTRSAVLLNPVQTPSVGVNEANELQVCRQCLDGNAPDFWQQDVMIFLTTVTPTDAQIDTAVLSAWPYLVNSRRS